MLSLTPFPYQQHDPESAASKVNEYRTKAAALGRDPKSLKVLAGICIVLGKTEEEAKAKFELWKGRASREGALALFGGWTGVSIFFYPASSVADTLLPCL